MAVCGAAGALRRVGSALAIFHPLAGFLRRAAAEVEADLGACTDEVAEPHQLVGAELVVFREPPGLVQFGGTLVDGPHAVTPVITAREIASAPKQWGVQGLGRTNDLRVEKAVHCV